MKFTNLETATDKHNVLLRESIQILVKKKSEKDALDPYSIDYSVLGEELEDVTAVIRDLTHYLDHKDIDEIELDTRLRGTMSTTTSGSILDSLEKYFAV